MCVSVMKKENDQGYTAIPVRDNLTPRPAGNKKGPHGKPCGPFTSLVKQPGPLAAAGSASLN
jgi:hypothetical protein